MIDNQRKHHTQMSKDELAKLHTALRSISNFSFKPHAIDRMAEKRVTETQLKAMLSYAKIIECHNNIADDIRVLVSGLVSGKRCKAVISLTRKEIVTTYWNNFDDTHKSLDWSKYKWRVNLTEIL